MGIPTTPAFVGLSLGTLSVDTHPITPQAQDELAEVTRNALYFTSVTPPSIDHHAPPDRCGLTDHP